MRYHTVCKISNLQSQSSYPVEVAKEGVEVVDKLVLSIDGYQVELRYASDPIGNKIMYVQLKQVKIFPALTSPLRFQKRSSRNAGVN